METAREAVFDEHGNTIQETEAAAPEVPDVEPEAEASETDAAPATEKYRIGNRSFATQDQALEYAQSQVSALETEQQIADAYRQGMRDSIQQPQTPQENVTPQTPRPDELNTEELYTNPSAFLDKFATKIKTETRSEIEQKDSLQRESDKIWREFTERHPALADFRTEVENFVAGSTTEVRAIIGTKGRPAGYDWIATKLKSRFENYANAVKPKRELPNGGAGASPSSKVGGVTAKIDPKKPLSFSEQIRTIRRRGR